MPRKIVKVIHDAKGVATHFKTSENGRKIPLEDMIKLVESGKIDGVHLSKTKKGRGGTKYVRSNPDGKKKNNLDNL